MDENYNPKICDFGLARCFPTSLSLSITKGIGTPLYMAPELFNCDDDSQYSSEVDVYAFAILAYEIVTGKMPYHELGKINFFRFGQKVMKGCCPQFPENFPVKLKILIEKCWSQSPNHLPTFDDIFNQFSKNLDILEEEVDKKRKEKKTYKICDDFIKSIDQHVSTIVS